MTTTTRSSQKFVYGPSPSQFYLLHHPVSTPPSAPSSPHPTFIFLHGGFWKSKYGLEPLTVHSRSLTNDLSSMLVAEIEYRRSEDHPWGWPHTNNDVLDAYKHIVARDDVNPDKIILAGHSAGGQLALWLAATLSESSYTPRPTLTVALAPVADLAMAARMRLSDNGDAVQRYMHGEPEDIGGEYEKACPTGHAETLARLNVALVAAGNDIDVPEKVVWSLYDTIGSFKRDCGAENGDWGVLQWLAIENADHFDVATGDTEAWKDIRAIIMREVSDDQSDRC